LDDLPGRRWRDGPVLPGQAANRPRRGRSNAHLPVPADTGSPGGLPRVFGTPRGAAPGVAGLEGAPSGTASQSRGGAVVCGGISSALCFTAPARAASLPALVL